MRHPRRRSLLWLAAPFLAVASSSCHSSRKVTHPRESQNDRLNDLAAHSRTVLTSRKKDGEVRIPFTLRDGGIHLKMVWAGRPVEALLDTGSAFVDWPQSLHLTSTSTAIPQDDDMAAGVVAHGEWMVLSSIKAGGCEWRNMLTVASGEMKRSGPSKTVTSPEPLLGAPAFRGTVLTIDYQKKEIIIRGASYDITRLPHHSHDLLLTPEWVDGWLPVLKGRLADHPARFALDSGCGGVVITTRFANRLPLSSFGSDTTAKINGVQVHIRGLKYISGAVAGIPFREDEVPVVDLPVWTHSDALAGTAFLERFRVTIDYTRHKVLLEPYSGGHQ